MINKTERNIIAICASCFFHFILLSHLSMTAKNHSDTQLLEVQIDFPLTCIREGKSFTLQSISEKNPRQDAPRKRLQARKLFLEQVADRVHRLRFLDAEKDLLVLLCFNSKLMLRGDSFRLLLYNLLVSLSLTGRREMRFQLPAGK